MNLEPYTLVHQTDLFRPHEDPDDHWDLATVFALHRIGAVELGGIIIDHPPPQHDGVPDLPAIEMLSDITGVARPQVAVGQAEPYIQSDPSTQTGPNPAADLILRILSESDRPVILNLAGSCRDVAVALRRDPDLFASSFSTIVLNAGTGYPASETGDEIEYNVRLDVEAFRAILTAPCPILWCPCFERLGVGLKVHEHGAWWVLEQGEILPALSDPLQAFFSYMYARDTDTDWKRWLEADRFRPVIDEQMGKKRSMWTTAGLLEAAGFSRHPSVVFEPVDVESRTNGSTTWVPAERSAIRKIRITDQAAYRSEMTDRLRSLLLRLSDA